MSRSLPPSFTTITTAGNMAYGHLPANVTAATSTRSRFDDIAEDIRMIKERLAILEPSFHLHEEYPALKAAYENYKLVERMVKSG